MVPVKPWWQSKTIIVGIVAAVFALLNSIHILPAFVSQDSVVECVMAVLAFLAIVLRWSSVTGVVNGITGGDNAIPWYKSRVIWVNLVAVIFAALSIFHIVPPDVSQEQVVTTLMGIVGVLTVIFRARSKSVIK